VRRTTKFRAAIVLFLCIILIGGSAAVSVAVAEVLSVFAIVIALAIVIFSIVGRRSDRKGR